MKGKPPPWISKRDWEEPLYQTTWLHCEQPPTCPYCGSSTMTTFDLKHSMRNTSVEKCINNKCNFEFAIEMDTDEITEFRILRILEWRRAKKLGQGTN